MRHCSFRIAPLRFGEVVLAASLLATIGCGEGGPGGGPGLSDGGGVKGPAVSQAGKGAKDLDPSVQVKTSRNKPTGAANTKGNAPSGTE